MSWAVMSGARHRTCPRSAWSTLPAGRPRNPWTCPWTWLAATRPVPGTGRVRFGQCGRLRQEARCGTLGTVAALAEHEVLVLDADGTALPYRRFGAQGKTRGSLVYLHGIQSHGGWYVETAAALAERGYTVFLPDRRGSGACGEPRGHFDSPDQLVEDVGRFVDL